MGYGQHLKSGYPTRAGGSPPIPSPTNSVLIASTWNWNPVGYVDSFANITDAITDGHSLNFLTDPPYAVDWAGFAGQSPVAPYLTDIFFDQSASANNLTQSGAARPTLDTAVKSPLGAAGCGLLGASKLYSAGSTAGAIYCSFKGNAAGWLVSTGDGSGAAGQIAATLSGGNLAVDLYGGGGNKQTKTKAIADNNWHWLAIKFDTTLAAANQLVVEIDDSTTGVAHGNVDDLGGQAMASVGNPSVFCKDAGGGPALAYPGYINTVIANSVADAAAVRTSYFKRWQYLMSTIGVTV